MIRHWTWIACAALAVAGCGTPEQTDTAVSTPPKVAPGGGAAPAPAATAYTFKEVKLADLPEADQELAKQQVSCLVSDEKLGTDEGMTPLQITADGKTVGFLCCDGCKEAFEGDPAKYLAKLKK